jgi:hypothetical protein
LPRPGGWPGRDSSVDHARPGIAGAPMCQNCREVRGVAVMMKGPMPDPSRRTEDLYFVCARCNHTMQDRRRARRETPDGGRR